MELIIEENEKKRLFFNDEIGCLQIYDFSELENINTVEDIFKYLIYSDEMFYFLGVKDEYLEIIYQYVTKKISYIKLEKSLEKNTISTTIINQINNYYNKYSKLIKRKITDITMRCNKDNLSKLLSSNLIKGKTTIESDNISFSDYYDLLNGIDLKKIDEMGVKIKIKECSKPISLSRLYHIVTIIKIEADKIKRLNLSNLEKVLYVYDTVKKRIYKEDKDNCRSSRDLDNVILGNDIVCVGYAKLMSAILSFYNIKATMVVSERESHAICLAYIKDEKYNIDGYLTFDATNDSRINEKDISYISKYNHFATSLHNVSNIFPIENIEEINISVEELSNKISNPDSDEKCRLLCTTEKLLQMSGKENFEEIVNNIISFDLLDSERQKALEKEYKILMNKLYMTSIDVNTFIKALYNTRRIEYYIGMIPEINIDAIRDSSVNWKMSHTDNEIKEEDKIMKLLFHWCTYSYLEENEERIISSSLKDNPSTERDMYNMRLVRVLKREIQKKTN